MAIESKKKIPETRLVAPSEEIIDVPEEATLRPTSLAEYVGQENVKRHLGIAVDSAKARRAPLEHVLLYGPPGLGKTTLSFILAKEMGANLKTTSGPAVEKPADLVSLLTGLSEGDVLFIDEIHRLKPQTEEILYSAMEDFAIDIMVGSGTGASSVRMEIPKFTLVGATTKLSKLTGPLRDRFGNVLKLDFYEDAELTRIAARSMRVLGMDGFDQAVAETVAKKSRGTPRIVNRFVKILRDYAVVGKDVKTSAGAEQVFEYLGIDAVGLDPLDRKLLSTLAYKFGGGPVGLNTLASIVGEEEETVEDVVEPFLLKAGFLERTPRGRRLTASGEDWIRRDGISEEVGSQTRLG